MQAAAAEGCSYFSLGRKVRMICENHMEVIIGNSTEGFSEQNLVSYLVSMLFHVFLIWPFTASDCKSLRT